MMPRTMSPPPKRPGSKWPGFIINRSGLPFDELTWSELWEFASYLYPGNKIIYLDDRLNVIEDRPTRHMLDTGLAIMLNK